MVVNTVERGGYVKNLKRGGNFHRSVLTERRSQQRISETLKQHTRPCEPEKNNFAVSVICDSRNFQKPQRKIEKKKGKISQKRERL